MSARFPFYEIAARRTEADGALRRCFRGADESERVLFVWQGGDVDVVQAQLLLGDETFVEWRAASVRAGHTNRLDADANLRGATQHARHKGVRTLEPAFDRQLLQRAREVLLASDLPGVLVEQLVRRLDPAQAEPH